MFSNLTESLIFYHQRARTRIFTWLISGLFSEFGERSRITPPFRFANLANIRLESGVIINENCWILAVRNEPNDKSVKLSIGRNSGIGMGATISAVKSVFLGDHVLLARNVYISDHGHKYEDVTQPIMRQGVDGTAPVTVGRHSWLGQNVVVLPGVSIGEHCIIGANSVVKYSVPDFSVAVGAPARVVKRFNKIAGRWERVKET